MVIWYNIIIKTELLAISCIQSEKLLYMYKHALKQSNDPISYMFKSSCLRNWCRKEQSQPKHPWCKKSCGQELKKGHAEKDGKSKWVAKASCC